MQRLEDKINHFFDSYAIFDVPTFNYWCEESYQRWLNEGCNGQMNYMSKQFRGEIERVFAGAQSVIVVLKYYGNKKREVGKALYSIGEDYHTQIKRELNEVLNVLKEVDPQIKGRAVVDTAPIFEKALAQYGGLGWVGRNSLIINEKLGSYFNIGILLIDRQLPETNHTITGSCGDCRACIDACPMSAIRDDKMVDARNCISYQTIELQRFNKSHGLEINGWSHGCDECQIACPHNKK